MPQKRVGCVELVAAAVILASVADAQVRLVDNSAGGTQSGLSWANAYVDLQDALEEADGNPAIEEIWVADGVYYPSSQTDPNEPRSATFSLISGLRIYGGFRGADSSDPNNPYPGELFRYERAPERNETVLSGNIGSPSSSSDNCWHVVSAAFVDETSVLNGFTIRDGNADTAGHLRGGGLNSIGSQAVVARCVFRENRAGSGGAVYNLGPSSGAATYANCSFLQNSAMNGDGGAIYSLMGRVHWINCLFAGNSAYGFGGAIGMTEHDVDSITSCTFSDNAAAEGGALWIAVEFNTDVVVANTIVWGNDPESIHVEQGSGGSLVVNYSDIEGASPYAGTANILADPQFCNPSTGNYSLQDGSACIGVGSNSAVPDDSSDVNDDGDLTESLPWDRGRFARIYPALGTVDMGAFENAHNQDCPADLDGDGGVGIGDLALLLSCFGQPAEGLCAPADMDCSGDVGLQDLAILLSAYGTCGGSFARAPGGDDDAAFFEWARQASIEELFGWYHTYLEGRE